MRLFLTILIGSFALGVLLLILSDPSQTISGLVKGERFYAGYSSSYWRGRQLEVGSFSGNMGVWHFFERNDDPKAIPLLLDFLRDDDVYIRRCAAYSLGQLGPNAKMAVPAMIDALKDPNSLVREELIRALGEIGPDARTALPFFFEGLKGDDKEVAKTCAYAIAKMGPHAKEGIPALHDALRDHRVTVRISAAHALWRLTHKSEPSVSTFMEAWKKENKDLGVRLWIVCIFNGMGPDAEAATPILLEALKDEDPHVRREARSALKAVNPNAAEAAGLPD